MGLINCTAPIRPDVASCCRFPTLDEKAELQLCSAHENSKWIFQLEGQCEGGMVHNKQIRRGSENKQIDIGRRLRKQRRARKHVNPERATMLRLHTRAAIQKYSPNNPL